MTKAKSPDLDPGIIYVDSRVGSREFAGPLKSKHKMRVGVTQLRSCDFAFTCGHTRPNPFCGGDNGCRIGIERKTVSDMVGSLMRNRMSKQVPDMLEDYTVSWILIEGLWRPGVDDDIEIPRAGKWGSARFPITYTQLSSWLCRYDVMSMGNIKRWRTSSPTETTAFVVSLYGWWQKEWDKHHAFVVEKMAAPIKALMRRPTDLERVAASLPRVGTENAKKVGRHFRSVLEMMNAEEDEWVRAGLGKKAAAVVAGSIRRAYR